tara:strand:+ start:589 stop:1524 length:936 start_codon:yes stop_codon:yes gene_type:complete
MRENALDIRNLSKVYAATGKASEKKALDDVILGVPKGSMFALLGPNGAGKSTLINILGGLVLKTGGSAEIAGLDLDQHPIESRRKIGIVGQEIAFDPFFTPREVLDIQAGLYGVPKKQRRTDELLELVGLTDKANTWSRQLSGGMKRRLMVAKAMVHDPEILILDEPTAGVDIELRRQLWDNVLELNRQGKTILLTTHYLEEAERLCDRIAIINHGKIIACDSKDALLSRIEGKTITFTLTEDVAELPESLRELGAEQTASAKISFTYSPRDRSVEQYIAALQKEGMQIADIRVVESDLEDVFLQLTRDAA